jgi:hypothetical protein
MARGIALTGNLDVGRIKIDGKDYLTVAVDSKAPTMLVYTFLGPRGGEYEILFADHKDDLKGRNPETCVILSPLLELGDGTRFGNEIVLEQPRPLTGQSPSLWDTIDRIEYY